MSSATDSLCEIAALRIELLDTDPLIWRQVEVPTSITLKVLHDVVRAAMGWYDQHLWEMRQGKQRYGQPIPGDNWGSPVVKADKLRLRDILEPRKTVLDHTYDFGDSWAHRLILTDIRSGDPAADYAPPPPSCAGRRRRAKGASRRLTGRSFVPTVSAPSQSALKAPQFGGSCRPAPRQSAELRAHEHQSA
ncbi:MAG TPA: plasmid pRiA4b ORF-3 family protein [Phenylobacterium sp.]|jgi:hypothetical protein|nr:plasmid pRiA4b ORF-3 family protein [Phenylobacterium sp.]